MTGQHETYDKLIDSWGRYINDGVEILGFSGVKTLYIKAAGENGVANLDWFELNNLQTPLLPMHIDEYDHTSSYGLCEWGYGIDCWNNGNCITFPPIKFWSKGTVKGVRTRY